VWPVLAGLLGVGLGVAIAWAVVHDAGPGTIPTFEAVRDAWRPSDLLLLDRHGEAVHELRVDAHGRRLAWTSLAEVSPALVRAVVLSEDRRFHAHGGVDARALAAAVAQRLAGGSLRGASTISMQVAALVDPGRGGPGRQRGQRTLEQKWRQMRRAWALEASWSKGEILEAYLNLATFRGELRGVAAAARGLFAKEPHGLTDGEAVVLAALLRGPNAAPAVVARRAVRLDSHAAAPSGSSRGAVAAALEALERQPTMGGPRVTLAPHAALRLLRVESGAALAPPSRWPAATLRSTLDATVQRVATERLREQLLAVRDRAVRDGAVLVADNATGEVLAYVGGAGELGSARWVDGIQARRQAGSALKPFLYGLALEDRLVTPASLIEDTPLDVPTATGLYRPRNYDERFAGLVSVRTALASSLNVPAVRTLGLVGPEAFRLRLRDLGVGGLDEPGDFYGPALALGSADVSLWELVQAYRTLATGGVWRPLLLAPDSTPRAGSRRVYPEAVAYLVSDVLAQRESRSATFGLENVLATRFWTAVKTGTSKDMRDNWCIGYSRRYTVGVWVGNFSGAPMRDVSGITGAAPVWRDVMMWLHQQGDTEPSRAPAPPSGVVSRRVVLEAAAEPSRLEWFLAGTEPASSGRGQEPARASGSRPALAGGPPPRILAPAEGTVVALDPDIPPARQRVVLEASGGGALRFVLDGGDLGPAAAPLLWPPAPGRHTLALVDEREAPVDLVIFEVRGGPSPRRGSVEATSP
jgi:penicillin-binding protein 1C